MVRIFLLTYTDLSGNEFSDIIKEIERELEEEDIAVAPVFEIVPLALASEMLEEDIPVAAVSDVVPVVPVSAVSAVIERFPILHDCNNVPISNHDSFICYAISSISLFNVN